MYRAYVTLTTSLAVFTRDAPRIVLNVVVGVVWASGELNHMSKGFRSTDDMQIPDSTNYVLTLLITCLTRLKIDTCRLTDVWNQLLQ